MAGAGGTGQPQPQPQQGGGVDLYDLLATEIARSLNAPQPQAPAPPQQQPLDPASAFAAARNPQFAPHLIQRAQAPEAARYAQQQAAFEAAMSGKQQALQSGTSLVNARSRAGGIGGRPALATIIDEQGNRISVNVHRGPDGRIAGIEEIGPSPWAPAILPAIPGVNPAQVYPKGVGGATATDIPGAVTPPPPAPVTEDYRKNAAFIQGTNHLRQAFRELKANTGTRGPIAGAIGQELGEFKYGGAIPYSAPNAKFESELRTTLDTMIVAITGLSFPEQAFRRYRAELPVATDSEEQAMQKIDNVVRKFLSEQRSIEQTYPTVGGGQATSQSESIVDKALRLAEERRRANP
jgi:hypothetical protein